MGAIADGRPVPELHHLSHGRGSAARKHMTAVADGVDTRRTLAVPRVVLVPDGLAELLDHGARLTAAVEAARLVHGLPFGDDVGRGAEVVFAHILDFLTEAVQGVLETVSHVAGVVLTRSGVGEDGPHAVVAGDDDEAFAVADIEDVIVSDVTVGSHADQIQLDVSVFLTDSRGAQELGTQFLGFLLVDRTSHQATNDSHQA